MNTIAVVGLSWGDEGKGKIVDLLSEKADIVARYQGGTNAGHTVYYKGEPLPLHLIPSGIFNKKTICVIGNGCVVNLKSLYEEIILLEKEGVDIQGRLFISDRAHITFPFHIYEDKKIEEIKGSKKVGTTFKGVGPTYTDKYARTGIRIADLLHLDDLKTLIEFNLSTKKWMREKFNIKSLLEECQPIVNKLKEYFVDTVLFLNSEIDKERKVLFEGAQGTLLDVDLGTYPYVTSSNPTIGGISTGTGVPSSKIKDVVGVAKAYATRIGEGPFPTVFERDFEDRFRKHAKEFGATTGRPRRCGWFDAVGIKYACMVNGVTSIAITKLDCLSGVDKIKVCVDYRTKDGKRVSSFPAYTKDLSETIPIYEEFKGWKQDIRGIVKARLLPSEALDYLKGLEDILNVDIAIISTGPNRKETIVKKEIW